MKWPDCQMAVLMRRDEQGGVYTAPCSCILCGLLRPCPLNTWVMACLCTVIRQTRTHAHTDCKKPSKSDTQTVTYTHRAEGHVDTAAAIIHRRGSLLEGVGGQNHDVSCRGGNVRGNYVCNKFHKPSIPVRAASLGHVFYVQFVSNLLFICINKQFPTATSRHPRVLFVVLCCLPVLGNLGLTDPTAWVQL